MKGRARLILGVTAAAALFASLAWYSFDLSLRARREVYRAAEFAGLMNPTGPLGGQIKGFNYQRNPAWVHLVASVLGAAAGFGPVLVATLLLYHRIAYGPFAATLCGRCGATLRNLAEPRCPRCRADL
jgi:hypothetical protein